MFRRHDRSLCKSDYHGTDYLGGKKRISSLNMGISAARGNLFANDYLPISSWADLKEAVI
jgi:hypothetical protein